MVQTAPVLLLLKTGFRKEKFLANSDEEEKHMLPTCARQYRINILRQLQFSSVSGGWRYAVWNQTSSGISNLLHVESSTRLSSLHH